MTSSNDEASQEAPAPKRGRRCRRAAIAVLVVLIVLQLVPYGRSHTNPPTTASVTWDSKTTEDLVRGACFDCHSNDTHWPWYSHVAPVSWLVQSDVDEGREHINFSTGKLDHLHEATEEVREGGMPPWFYRPLHSRANLSDAEKESLLRGLRATFGDKAMDEGEGHEQGQEDDDGD